MANDPITKEVNAPTKNSEPSDLGRRQFLTNAAATAATVAAVGAGITGASSAFSQSEDKGEDGNKEFAGRCAFITGGARGIGFATAQVLAEAGANIVLYDIAGQIEGVKYPLATEEDLANAKREIEALGVGCIAIQADVRDGALQKEVMGQAVTEFGSLDFVIANAGITQTGTLDSFSEEEVSLVLDINLAGAIKTVQAAIPIMREQNSGRIVLMSSVTGRNGSPAFPIYSASKWGMIGVVKGTAQLMGPHNVTVNAICPDLVHTKLLDNEYVLNSLFPDNPTFEAFNEAAKQFHPLPVGLFEAVHVGNLIRFICSDSAKYISGDVFDIQAGANSQNLG